MKNVFAVPLSALILAIAAVAAHAQAAGETVWDGRDVYMRLSSANAEKAPVDECTSLPQAAPRVVITISPKGSSQPITLKLDYAGCELQQQRDPVETDPLLTVRKYNSGKAALILTGVQGETASSVFLSLGDGRFLYANPQAAEASIANANLSSGRTTDLGDVVVMSGYHQECKGLWLGAAKASVQAE